MILDKTAELIKKLNEYAYHYYVLDSPIASDKEYDALYNELLEIEAVEGVREDSPTRRVGGEVLDGFVKHSHILPLYSLEKANTIEALYAWRDKVEEVVGDKVHYTLEYKFDGLTLNLTYNNGQLIQAATRGDGVTGESVLSQVRTISSIPLSIEYKGLMEVQGEAIMRLSALEAYNKAAIEPLKNARNAAAGALRSLDTRIAAERKLDAFFYSIGYIEGKEFASHMEMIGFLEENRFKISPMVESFVGMEELVETLKKVEKTRPQLDFLIDGMVIKVDDTASRAALGYTQKFPKWAIAFKFAAEEITTTVREVLWEVGRTGRVNPSAVVDSVELCGATVKRATLNNIEDIKRKNIRLGARVFIRRSNDVIPEILGAVKGQEQLPEIEKPTVCPACGTELEQIGPNLFCPNSISCKPQLIAALAHFMSRDAMNIDSASEKTAAVLLEKCGVRDVAALYRLTLEQLLQLPGFKEKKANKLLASIEESKHPELENFIYALGIDNVGKKTARDLAATFNSLERIAHASYEELVAIRDVGEIVAQCILDFFADSHTTELLERLAEYGVTPKPYESVLGAMVGMNVVVTGTLKLLNRVEALGLIKRAGGTPQNNVSKTTTLLVAGEKAGSKLEKAQKLGIKIISEEELLELCGR